MEYKTDNTKMNSKAFTLLEVIIALILASVLTIGSVKVIENMQRETERFRQQVDDDMTWLTANHHLAKNVRASSYLERPDATHLTLFNYDESVKGRYEVAGNELRYYLGASATPKDRFPGTNLAFAFLTAPKGWRNGRAIEVIINYARPFASVLYLRCVADTPLWNTWAKTFGRSGQERAYSVQCTSDGGYILAGNIEEDAFNSDFYIIKTSDNGKAVWSKISGEIHSWKKYAYSVKQDLSGNYVVAGYYDAGITTAAYFVKFLPDGGRLFNGAMSMVPYSSARDIEIIPGGSYITCGRCIAISEGMLAKIGPTMLYTWHRRFGSTGLVEMRSVYRTSDTGYISCKNKFGRRIGARVGQNNWR
jgi:prepilin-type N-terminal cleavage/methylation domain-containing protein